MEHYLIILLEQLLKASVYDSVDVSWYKLLLLLFSDKYQANLTVLSTKLARTMFEIFATKQN